MNLGGREMCSGSEREWSDIGPTRKFRKLELEFLVEWNALNITLKVAEHSFRERFNLYKHVVDRAIILFIQKPHYLRYFSLLLNAVY